MLRVNATLTFNTALQHDDVWQKPDGWYDPNTVAMFLRTDYRNAVVVNSKVAIMQRGMVNNKFDHSYIVVDRKGNEISKHNEVAHAIVAASQE